MQYSGATRRPAQPRFRRDTRNDDDDEDSPSVQDDLSEVHSAPAEGAPRRHKALPKEVDLNLHEEDDEDVRLERNRKKLIAAELAELKSRGRGDSKIMEVYADSPNGYRIVSEQPVVVDGYTFDLAVKHYSFHLRHFLPLEYPDEYGICHYNLGKLFMVAMREETMAGGSMSGPTAEKRVKNIENAIFHFRAALRVFTFYSHPMMYAVTATMIGQLFRERFILYEHRHFVAKRNAAGEGLQNGIDQLMEGLPVLAQAPTLALEHSICCLEIAYLYYLMLKPKDYPSKDVVSDQDKEATLELAVSNLERSFSLSAMLEQAAAGTLRTSRVVPPRTWDLSDPTSHPPHVAILLTGRSLRYLEGLGHYLLGLIYRRWGPELYYQEQAFEHLARCVKSKYLPPDSEQWMDAHCRTADIITGNPRVVEPDWLPGSHSDLYLQSAIRHLEQALRYPALAGRRQMEVNFSLAQAHISRLYLITDHVPYGSSLTQAIADKGGMEILLAAEEFLRESSVHTTAANSQSVFDAYVFFFSRLKFAEFRMLENALSPSLSADQRTELLRSSVVNLVDALRARTEADNLDLHLVALMHMAHILLSSRKYVPAMKAYAKALMTASGVVTRQLFSFALLSTKKSAGMVDKLVTQSLIALSKESVFVKHHLGPLSPALVETGVGTPGVAFWALEQEDPWGDNVLLAAPATAASRAGSPSPRGRAPPSSSKSGKRGRSSSPEPDIRPQPPLLPPPASIALGRASPPAVDKASLAGSVQVPPLDLSSPLRPQGAPPLSAFAGAAAANIDVDNLSVYRRRRRRRVPTVVEISKFLEELQEVKRRSEHRLAQDEAGNGSSLMPSHAQASYFKKGSDRKGGSGGGSRPSVLPPVDSSRGGLLAAIKSLFRKDVSTTFRDDSRYTRHAKSNAHLWGSNQCLYALMVASRAARMALVLRSSSVAALQGQRSQAALSAVPRGVREEVARLAEQLTAACSGLVAMPSSVKELSHRSDSDLRVIFNNYPQVHRLLQSLERILEERVTTEDFFVPLVLAAPSLSRDREAYDRSLLFASALLQSMRVQAQGKALARAGRKKGAKPGSPRRAKDEPAAQRPLAAAPIVEEQRPTFQQELEEGRRQGKMTAELCQLLDGSLKGDIREVFTQYLQPDECLINYHLPSQASQKLQAVLVWRESQSAPPASESEKERIARYPYPALTT